MHIREATHDDNEELKQLQARCPQGTTLIVSTVNTPDFFARAKAYEDYKVYVALEENRIIGSAACAIRDAFINSKTEKVGHEFQLFVDPEFRGRRIAGQLHQIREDYLREHGAILSYAIIMEGNIPSMRYIARQGFKWHRTLLMPGLAIFKEMTVKPEDKVRPITTDDLPAVAKLLNETWQGYELYEPMCANRLLQAITRTPAYHFDNIFVVEEGGEILACLGFWDWSQVTKITVERLSMKMRLIGLLADLARYFRPMPSVPRVGELLKQMVLTLIAFKDPKYLAILLRHMNNSALRSGIGYIYCICERDHPLLASMKGFARIDTAMHVYVKPLRENVSISNKPIFINGIDV